MSEHDDRKCRSRFDCIGNAKTTFRERYLHRFVPALVSIDKHRSALTIFERVRAVRFAADMSLVLATPGDVYWSHALGRKLSRQLLTEDTCNVCKVGSSSGCSTPCFMRRVPWFQSQRNEKTSVDAAAVPMEMNAWARQHQRRSLQKRIKSKNVTKVAWQRAYIKALRQRCANKNKVRVHTSEEPAKNQIKSLQNLVPGGNELMDTGTLFTETANYILSLQMQVDALNTLAEACDALS